MGNESRSRRDVTAPSAGSFRETSQFATLFGRHIQHGTGRNRPGTWDKAEFCRQVAKSHKLVKQPGEKDISQPTTKSFANWCQGIPPRPTTMLAILHVFFGDNPDLEPRRALLSAWELASKRALPAATSDQAFDGPPSGERLPRMEPTPKTSRKLPSKLVDMVIDTAGRSQGYGPDYFPVVVALSWSVEATDEPGIILSIGLKTFHLTYQEQNCIPVPRTFYADGDTIDGVKREGRTWIFTAPEGSVLRGAPPRLDNLVHMKRSDDAAGLPSITVRATCPSEFDLDIVPRAKGARVAGGCPGRHPPLPGEIPGCPRWYCGPWLGHSAGDEEG